MAILPILPECYSFFLGEYKSDATPSHQRGLHAAPGNGASLKQPAGNFGTRVLALSDDAMREGVCVAVQVDCNLQDGRLQGIAIVADWSLQDWRVLGVFCV